MGKAQISKEKISKIIELRRKGLSLNEIRKEVLVGKSTIFKYLKGVKTPFDLRNTGSIRKSKREWEYARGIASNLIKTISGKERMLILACLYWGEGNKKELNLINSDPDLIRIFISCLMDIGVKKEDLLVSVRMYEDMNIGKVQNFWSKITGVGKNSMKKADILVGKKIGKLEYGMCRVRVRKSGTYFKLIMSMVDLIRSGV
ncbi:MAG: hypothetical protein WCX27_02060 [Candidatus Paceibacterota bacterium]|jgi:hypothetical protein